MKRQTIALLAGPLLFLLCFLIPAQSGLSFHAKVSAGLTVWMAVWWITEALEPAVTSLLPLVVFPLFGVLPMKTLSAEYGNEIIFLFLSGFLFGKTIERWGLHRRIALGLIYRLGDNPSHMVLGFMAATAFISMWISNTATAVMMTPVAIAVAGSANADDKHSFAKALLLGVGYACSIGGLATVVGTPTNGIFLSFVSQKMGETVSFSKWFVFGFPFVLLLLLFCWKLLVWMFPLPARSGNERASIQAELRALGPLSTPEKRLLMVFGAVIFCWMSGSLAWYRYIPLINDNLVAVAGAILLFVTRSGRPENSAEPLLDWSNAVQIPWSIILFFGGGLALAKGFDAGGLDDWLGAKLVSLHHLPHGLILFVVLAIVVLLSEIASNIATASMMMPVLAVLAGSIGAHPFGLLISATVAASFGFGLPVATAPNTIVYASGYLTPRDMARAGFILDLLAILLLLIFIYAWLPIVWGIRV